LPTRSWLRSVRGVADMLNYSSKLPLQFPTLLHGGVTVTDSSCIFKYLQATYPERMAVFGSKDAKTCAARFALPHAAACAAME
jgi:hypothetical protein